MIAASTRSKPRLSDWWMKPAQLSNRVEAVMDEGPLLIEMQHVCRCRCYQIGLWCASPETGRSTEYSVPWGWENCDEIKSNYVNTCHAIDVMWCDRYMWCDRCMHVCDVIGAYDVIDTCDTIDTVTRSCDAIDACMYVMQSMHMMRSMHVMQSLHACMWTYRCMWCDRYMHVSDRCFLIAWSLTYRLNPDP